MLSPNDLFRIAIYDEDIFSDDFLGETTLSMRQILKPRANEELVDVFISEKRSGGIKIVAKLVTKDELE